MEDPAQQKVNALRFCMAAKISADSSPDRKHLRSAHKH
jgi:hypothetical protein